MDDIVLFLFLFLLSFQKVGNNHESYRKSSIKPPGGLIYFKPIWGGGLFNLKTTIVSVLHKELDCKVEKLKYKKF